MEFDLKESLGFYRKPDFNEWVAAGPDKAEILASAGCAVGAAVIERVRAGGAAEKPVDPDVAKEIEVGLAERHAERWSVAAMTENSYGVQRGLAAVEEQSLIPLVKEIPMDISVDPKGPDEALVMRWSSEVQSTARQNWLRLGQVVVYAVEAGWVRGALLGEASDRPIPGVELSGAKANYDPNRGRKSLKPGVNYYDYRLSTGQLFNQGARDK